MSSIRWRAVALASAVTLPITGLRLLGELSDWNPHWFSKEPGGGAALVGIGWLIPLFGIAFARVLAREREGPRDGGRSLRLAVIGLLPVAIAFCVARLAMDPTPLAMAIGGAGCVVSGAVAWRAWPALARMLLATAVLARLPVMAITIADVSLGWGTHYGKLARGAAPLEPVPRVFVLCLAQVILWLPLSVLLGVLAGTAWVRFVRGTSAARRNGSEPREGGSGELAR
jgi:hypothetical protein